MDYGRGMGYRKYGRTTRWAYLIQKDIESIKCTLVMVPEAAPEPERGKEETEN